MKKFLIILVIFFSLLSLFWIWLFTDLSSDFKKNMVKKIQPEITALNVKVTSLGQEEINVALKLSLYNKLPAKIKIHQLDCEIYIDSIKVLTEKFDESVVLEGLDTTQVELPVKLISKPLSNVMDYLDKRNIDSAQYRIKGVLLATIPMKGRKVYLFDEAKIFPVFRLPTIKITDKKFHILKLKKNGIDVTVLLTNNNAYPMKLKDGKVNFILSNDASLNARLPSVLEVQPKSTKAFPLHLNVKEANVPETVWDVLINKKNTDFTYTIDAIILSEKEQLNNTALHLKIKGTLDNLPGGD